MLSYTLFQGSLSQASELSDLYGCQVGTNACRATGPSSSPHMHSFGPVPRERVTKACKKTLSNG